MFRCLTTLLTTLLTTAALEPLPQVAPQAGAAQLQFKFFSYPGTSYPTRLIGINDSGVAVGFFAPSPDGKCDPAVFGEPCPTAVSDLNQPFAFTYANGKFTRFPGDYHAGNNLPVSINNRGDVLLKHGKFRQMPMNVGFSWVVLNMPTGQARGIAARGNDGKTASTTSESMNVSITPVGLNSTGMITGLAAIYTQSLVSEHGGMYPRNKAYLAPGYGVAGTFPLGKPELSKPGRFQELDTAALHECAGTDYSRSDFQIAGPNDKGQIAASCGRDLVIYDTAAKTSTSYKAPDAQYSIHVMGISTLGAVVGCSPSYAFVYRDGKYTGLPLPHKEPTCALGINSNGEIVGSIGDKAFYASPIH